MKSLITFFNSTANDNAAVQMFLQDVLNTYFGDMELSVEGNGSGHFILPVPQLPKERVNDCHDLYDKLFEIFGGLNDRGSIALHRVGVGKITEGPNRMEVHGSPVFLLGKIHKHDRAAFASLGDRLSAAKPHAPMCG
jgi:hypothetical protein